MYSFMSFWRSAGSFASFICPTRACILSRFSSIFWNLVGAASAAGISVAIVADVSAGAEVSAGAAASAFGASAQAEVTSIMPIAITIDLAFMVLSKTIIEGG